TPPPALEPEDERHPRHDPRYASLEPQQLPATESLKLTLERVLPSWEAEIAPALHRHNCVLIAAHGNSLRALVKHLDGLADDAIMNVEIPTGRPLIYELDDKLGVERSYYLQD
ncbi:MAG: 2,3-bisphosphoglycerate-dependent phosphoglycerate mutase, partial [Halorhodospira sp.]